MLLQTNAKIYSLLESDLMLCGTQVAAKQWYII
jgi:hypothetical protein